MNMFEFIKKRQNNFIKNLFNFFLIFFLITIVFISEVNASSNLSTKSDPQVKIAKKYAEKFCIAKEDNLFEGLKNEKDLKYSYFRYIGSQTIDIFSNEIYEILINQIKEKCKIENEEEIELLEFFKQEFKDK